MVENHRERKHIIILTKSEQLVVCVVMIMHKREKMYGYSKKLFDICELKFASEKSNRL